MGEHNGNGNGRQINGKWAPGNAGGLGGRLDKHQHEIRKWFAECVTKEDVIETYNRLMGLVRENDITAIREYLDRVLGKAKQPVELAGHDGGRLDLHSVTSVILSVIGNDDALRVRIAAAFSELGKARGRDAIELDA